MQNKQLGTTYEPKDIETDIYTWWEREGYFRPEKQRELGLVTAESPRWCLTLPPPNITGQLHLGHAITVALEDLMTRYQRMLGKETLFLPGSDHAGIATQNVVERELAKKGIKRKDLGRDKFLDEVWKWKDEYHARITKQSKHLGMSCDWTRERFTLDEDLSRAVRTAFVTLYKEGLIYRGEYMVNWCPGRCESAISDLEAIPEEVNSHLWYFKYPVINDTWTGPAGEWGSGTWARGATEFIEVATTRPETLLGDTGVATHEAHPVYGKWIGRQAVVPVVGRAIPIFADHLVDPAFGTGAVKVTPAHDPNDLDMGQRHGLDTITVMTGKGEMIPEHSGKYAGMDRFDCRRAIVEDLEKEGLLVKIDPYTHAVSHCQRCHAVIEPRVSMQWFVKMKDLADAAALCVAKGDSKILPEREEKRFFQWMENIKDWCISRQLWWGHRIPVWYCSNGHLACDLDDPTSCPECGDTKLVQDEDVLDTWFSSGLWPFSTLGWPDTDHPDFKRFYPTDVRETGYDILFFWVAREMMLGKKLTGEAPYHTIYLHGIVRNESGKKISKSMENIEQYDPLTIIEQHGCDVLRHMLVSNAVPGQDVNLDFRQLEASKRFCNKIWQSTKFVLGHISHDEEVPRLTAGYPSDRLCLVDTWILGKLRDTITSVTRFMNEHDYLNATRTIKSFFWDDFCDWYIEAAKIRLFDERDDADKTTPKVILLHVLDACLKMLHPTLPHVTEALWQAIPASIKQGPALIVAPWPVVDTIPDAGDGAAFATIIDIVRGIRSLRTTFNVPPGPRIPVLVDAGGKVAGITEGKDEIISMARVDPASLVIGTGITAPARSARLVLPGITVHLPLEGIIDVDKERARMEQALVKVEALVDKTRKKLAGPFSQKAEPALVEQEREKLAQLEDQATQLVQQVKALQ